MIIINMLLATFTFCYLDNYNSCLMNTSLAFIKQAQNPAGVFNTKHNLQFRSPSEAMGPYKITWGHCCEGLIFVLKKNLDSTRCCGARL